MTSCVIWPEHSACSHDPHTATCPTKATIPSSTLSLKQTAPRPVSHSMLPRARTLLTSALNHLSTTARTMSTTFTHPDSQIPITLPSETETSPTLTQQELLAFPAFKTWHATLLRSLALQHTIPTHPFHASPYALKSIAITGVDRFGHNPSRLGFVKLRADVRNTADETLPGVALLRGGSVGMLVVLTVRGGGGAGMFRKGARDEEYALLTVQARVAAGSMAFAELPAGMLDAAGSFAGAAAAEMEEECGLRVREEEMVDLTGLVWEAEGEGEGEGLQRAVYTSPGGQDEFVPLMLVRRDVSKEDMEAMKGKLTGLRDEGEKITLKVVRLADVWKEAGRDAKALSAIAIYEGLKREGRL
ncbi:hypothetical protein FH972_023725 [Carpinus fangiana]|uniref:Nudix hydrolase domain-containing protein n=1 Tax=Carpinus fangiana TaxID=176857 RepID=A0A5N6KYH2_9ROSI|nr:hypothetical protein FH972_023725 [Carpinus fangiana]